MRSFTYPLALLLCLLFASPAAAQLVGAWHVTGQIAGNAFTVDCQFTPDAAGFGGVCVDAANGKWHVLSRGSVSGSQVQWSYPASYMMMGFSVTYTGTLSGGSMTGTVTAAGRKGNFTAARG
jgi:hypothetical protein